MFVPKTTVDKNTCLILWQNNTVALDQDSYDKRYNGLVERYEACKKRLDELKEQRSVRREKASAINQFLHRLSERDEPLTVFTAGLWIDSIDKVTVQPDGAMVFRFLGGNEVTVE